MEIGLQESCSELHTLLRHRGYMIFYYHFEVKMHGDKFT